MAPSSRLAVRFAQLPHDALAELAAQLCADGGAVAVAQAEAVLAAHQPVPQWAVEGVLLSSGGHHDVRRPQRVRQPDAGLGAGRAVQRAAGPEPPPLPGRRVAALCARRGPALQALGVVQDVGGTISQGAVCRPEGGQAARRPGRWQGVESVAGPHS